MAALALLALGAAAAPAAAIDIRINCGGPADSTEFPAFGAEAYLDYVAAGSSELRSNSIERSGVYYKAGTSVYQYQRWGVFGYRFTGLTPSGAYTVKLHFSDNYFTAPGQRKFHVYLQGTPVLVDYDIISQAGAQSRAIAERFQATASSAGQLTVDFAQGSADFPTVAGIEVLEGATTPGEVLFGVFDNAPNEAEPLPWTRLDDQEAWLGKTNGVVLYFTDWRAALDPGGAYDRQSGDFASAQRIWDRGAVPLLTWELTTAVGTQPADICVRAARGDYDAYLQEWLDDTGYPTVSHSGTLKAFLAGPDGILGTTPNDPAAADDRRMYIRLSHEMNGNWYPWSANGVQTPADYIAMWRHVVDFYAARGIGPLHVQWMWAPYDFDAGQAAELYFPGTSYVDWVGVSGHNWGGENGYGWYSPVQIFNTMIDRLVGSAGIAAGKPVSIPEMSSGSDNGCDIGCTNVWAKGKWVEEMYDYAGTKGRLYSDPAKVNMIVWFNIMKETDWSIFDDSTAVDWDGLPARGTDSFVGLGGTYPCYNAYKNYVTQSHFVGGNTTNPRRLTEARFRGSSDTVAPATPTAASASSSAPGQMSVAWTASSDNVGVKQYDVFRAGIFLGRSTTTSYTDSGLTPGATYCYEVSAEDAAGNESGRSAPVGATTALNTKFYDGFEVDLANWTIGGSTGGSWAKATDQKADGAASARASGNTGSGERTLTKTAAVNLAGATQAELRFFWQISGSMDAGEYVRLDLYYGGAWHNGVAQLSGNVSPEDSWTPVTIDLDAIGAATSDFKLRFAHKSSATNEYSWVDAVRIDANQ